MLRPQKGCCAKQPSPKTHLHAPFNDARRSTQTCVIEKKNIKIRSPSTDKDTDHTTGKQAAAVASRSGRVPGRPETRQRLCLPCSGPAWHTADLLATGEGSVDTRQTIGHGGRQMGHTANHLHTAEMPADTRQTFCTANF
jgi:hypothetical protein